MKRAAIYSRVSTPGQAEDDKASLSEQAQRCLQYCNEKGYQVTAEYRDIGSGMTKKRPDFVEMLKEARNNKFDVIVAWKTDRLARGIYPCAALMESLENTGISVETVAEPFDRTTFEIRAVVGRIEVENFVQRSVMGKEAKIKAGNHHNLAPFGYDYDCTSHRWVINEAQAEWVRQIFDWYVDGLSSNKIAYKLNAAGVPTKHHSRLGWAEKTVSLIVSQEYYTGLAYYNKYHRGRGKSKSRDKWIPMSVPAIISREVWEAAQLRRAHNKVHSPRNTKQAYITQHVLQCEECGTRFHISSGWGNQPRMMCLRMIRYTYSTPCRMPKSLAYDEVAERLWRGVAEVVGSETGLEAAILASVDRVTSQRATIEDRLKELTGKRSDLKLEQDRVISWARKGNITEAQLDLQLRAIQAEDDQYTTEQDRLLSDLRLIGDSQTVYQQARQLIPTMKNRLDGELTDEEKQDVIDLLVRRALVDGAGNLTIEFKVPHPEMCFDFSTPS